MPGTLSKQLSAKILGREWSFGYNCYEVGHTWTPSCTGAALEVSLAAAIKVLPLYALLYSFSQLAVQQRYDLDATWDTTKSACRSTFFIFFHAYNGSLLGCALRHAFGRFYYRVLVCAPALFSCYLSLLIEKPSRRQALAFYLLNMASEIIYRMAVTKGHFTPIKHGETLLFSISLAAWYYLLKTHGFGHDPISGAVKVLIGRDEAKSRSKRRSSNINGCSNKPVPSPPQSVAVVAKQVDAPIKASSTSNQRDRLVTCQQQNQFATTSQTKDSLNVNANANSSDSGSSSSRVSAIKRTGKLDSILASACAGAIKLGELIDFAGNKWLDGRHASCPHQNEATCLRYVLQPIVSRFLIGHCIQSLLRLSSKPYQLLEQPGATVQEAFSSTASVRFGLFLVSLVSSGRATSCLLRRYSNSNEPNWHGLVSGLLAGSSMLWAPKSSLSMYVMWKAVEQYYLLAASNQRKSYFNFTIATIYSFSAATILYTFALEPRFVRPSYMKFIDRMSDHRLHQLNRMVLDVFGTGSSVGYEDYFPNLDPKYMSNQFKELVFNWMIQPYE